MRAIKFRGKRLGDKKWVYGDLLHGDQSVNENKAYIQNGSPFEVDVTTVGQFTGMCDGKGKKIYEGDILRVVSLHYETLGKGCVAVVSWDRGCFWVYRADACELKQSLTSVELENEIEVIGNIFDNVNLIR